MSRRCRSFPRSACPQSSRHTPCAVADGTRTGCGFFRSRSRETSGHFAELPNSHEFGYGTRSVPATFRSAFSLLEVVLALAILTTALTFCLGLVDLGVRGASGARDQTRAQELAESVLSMIVAGMIEPQQYEGSVSSIWSLAGIQYAAGQDLDLEFEEDQWNVSISSEQADLPNMLKITVTVSEKNAVQAPREFTLVRWLRDPAYLETLGQQTTTGGMP
jgi:Tfp pilus assembly protein PilV